MDSDGHAKSRLIGKDIPWEVVEKVDFRVKEFTPLATVKEGKIKHDTKSLPYAVLLLESIELRSHKRVSMHVVDKEVSMHVVHKDDFLRLWMVFKERGAKPEEEVSVFYVPFYRSRLLSRFMPRIHIYIYPRGHMEQANDPNFHPEDISAWFEPIATLEPKNWKYWG